MLRVLVVDDSRTERLLIRRVLETDPGIKVVGEAVDGRQAVELAQELEPDLITMDVVMPDMDGVEAAQRILTVRTVPILLVTARSDSARIWNAFEVMKAGALDVLGKPSGGSEDERATWADELIRRVRVLSGLDLGGDVPDQARLQRR